MKNYVQSQVCDEKKDTFLPAQKPVPYIEQELQGPHQSIRKRVVMVIIINELAYVNFPFSSNWEQIRIDNLSYTIPTHQITIRNILAYDCIASFLLDPHFQELFLCNPRTLAEGIARIDAKLTEKPSFSDSGASENRIGVNEGAKHRPAQSIIEYQ